MKLWICQQNIDETPEAGVVAEFQGIFDSEEKAIAACRNEKYWIAPVNLNQELPDESSPFLGAYFPHSRKQ